MFSQFSHPNSISTSGRLRWISDARSRYRGMTPRQLTVELLELGAEITEAESFNLVNRQVVDLLAGERSRIARAELQGRIAGDRA